MQFFSIIGFSYKKNYELNQE